MPEVFLILEAVTEAVEPGLCESSDVLPIDETLEVRDLT
jgi:hypothetical protein